MTAQDLQPRKYNMRARRRLVIGLVIVYAIMFGYVAALAWSVS